MVTWACLGFGIGAIGAFDALGGAATWSPPVVGVAGDAGVTATSVGEPSDKAPAGSVTGPRPWGSVVVELSASWRCGEESFSEYAPSNTAAAKGAANAIFEIFSMI